MHLQCYIVPPDNFPSHLLEGKSIRNQYSVLVIRMPITKKKNQKKSQIKIDT